jgi:hypothetical protein
MGGEDFCYIEFAPFLRERLLLTGFHGDKIWERTVSPNKALSRGDISGSSLQEFRLRHNFVHIPVPMIGALRHADISAISNSPEMAPYTLHTSYDRPIPRRLLEESGVPRLLFGQKKKAASILLNAYWNLLSAEAKKECESLVSPAWVRKAHARLRRSIWLARALAYRALNRFGASRIAKFVVWDWRLFEHSQARSSLRFGAAIVHLRRDYSKALKCRSKEASTAPTGVFARPGRHF